MDIKLGILGGLGPAATANFMNQIIQMSEASTDQEHIDMLIANVPSIPDRTSYIKNSIKEPNPLTKMVEIAKFMEESGVESIAIPCITAHYFHYELAQNCQCNIFNAVEETAKYLKKHNISKVGVLATDGTIKSELFQKTLLEYNVEPVIPSEHNQEKVMDIIYDQVKKGHSVDMKLFNSISDELLDKGAEVIILGCTELSIIKNSQAIEGRYLDVIDVLAMRCVEEYGKVKEEYQELITN